MKLPEQRIIYAVRKVETLGYIIFVEEEQKLLYTRMLLPENIKVIENPREMTVPELVSFPFQCILPSAICETREEFDILIGEYNGSEITYSETLQEVVDFLIRQ